ncbi:nucleoside triphosphate pyrophosphatase [Magnetovibrio sp.]|uniref:Maf family protein n=1 Tax=Magnetovibrio sp. TaxID=2024836 RepID=UPI002F932DC6
MRPPEIVLASASTARTRMLTNAGVRHCCDPADIDETSIKQNWLGSPQGLAQKLAFEKARVVSLRHRGALVIGSDQILALDDEILDKPGSVEAAAEQLRQLRGHTHRLISAVSVVCDDQELWTYSDHADLSMRDFSDVFLHDYLDHVGADVTSSVGAYHLEGLGAQLFQSIEGDFFTVLGMPLIALLNFLRHKGALTL